MTLILSFSHKIVEPDDWEGQLEQTLEDFQRKHNKAILYTVLYY